MKKYSMVAIAAAALSLGLGTSIAQEKVKKPAEGSSSKQAAQGTKAQSSSGARRQTQPSEVLVKGVIKDAAGNPAAGAKIGLNMTLADGKAKLNEVATTGEDGSFEYKATGYPAMYLERGRALNLIAYSADGKQAGVFSIANKEAAGSASGTLAPVATVKFALDCVSKEAKLSVSATIKCKVGDQEQSAALFRTGNQVAGASYEVSIPAGALEIRVSGGRADGLGYVFLKANLASGKNAELGTASVPKDAKVEFHGKQAPEIQVTEGRNLPEGEGENFGLKLADYKGKWILVEFWGYW